MSQLFSLGVEYLTFTSAGMNSIWFSCSGRSKIELEDISETLYTRPSLLSDFSNLSVSEINKRFVKVTRSETKCRDRHEKTKNKKRRSITKSSLTVNFTVVEMLRGKIRPKNLSHDVSRWSDCDCGFCTSWGSTSNKDHSLFVKTQIPNGKEFTFLFEYIWFNLEM